MLCGEFEDGLATVPCTEKTACLARIGTLIERTMQDVEWYSMLMAEVLKICAVGFVWYVVHDDMNSLYCYLRTIDS